MSENTELSCKSGESCATAALTRPDVPVYKPHYTSRYDEEAWEVSIRLPGVRKETVKVTIENEVLDVSASRRFEAPENWRPLGRGNRDRDYRLRLDVGPEVDESQVSAQLEDGILTLRLPLREEVKPRTVEVK